MEREQAWALLDRARVAILATLRADGSPRLVPCVHAVHGSTVYVPVDAKPKRTRSLARLSDIRRDPRVGLLAHEWSEDWAQLWWVRLDGRASLAAGEELRLARARLFERYPQYTDPAELDPVITITVTAWRAWRAVEPPP
ncbi:MAG TPA: TIGR03668 family PPOX class F420-dependent oxidoreductase [Candidatus Saccharimonadales bacterium]|nr:TIGR03668 family PPOX class F420-dependent oxidoreductase [Candidatus Saccharimonadales bacterium]